MSQNNDQVVEESVNTPVADPANNMVGLIVTTSSMVEFLLNAGQVASRIEDRIGADNGFVKGALTDQANYDPSTSTDEVKRLRMLYLRKQLKFLYRKHAFIGAKKAASKIGISLNEFDFIYNGLIASGELKFKLSVPTWGDPEKKNMLREHVVV